MRSTPHVSPLRHHCAPARLYDARRGLAVLWPTLAIGCMACLFGIRSSPDRLPARAPLVARCPTYRRRCCRNAAGRGDGRGPSDASGKRRCMRSISNRAFVMSSRSSAPSRRSARPRQLGWRATPARTTPRCVDITAICSFSASAKARACAASASVPASWWSYRCGESGVIGDAAGRNRVG